MWQIKKAIAIYQFMYAKKLTMLKLQINQKQIVFIIRYTDFLTRNLKITHSHIFYYLNFSHHSSIVWLNPINQNMWLSCCIEIELLFLSPFIEAAHINITISVFKLLWDAQWYDTGEVKYLHIARHLTLETWLDETFWSTERCGQILLQTDKLICMWEKRVL